MWCNAATLTNLHTLQSARSDTESSQYISVKYSSEEVIPMTFQQIRRLVQHYLHHLCNGANFLYELIAQITGRGNKTGVSHPS